jgi:hypothetical protein
VSFNRPLQEACELIGWYRARWEIAMFFNVPKEGCRVEQMQLGETGRLQTALALYMVNSLAHLPPDATGAHLAGPASGLAV